uniref:Uncharacterized protein n=1 Tax=Bicosoecida sp. CB-2014 TaxID=1486930 RepID=A0A7S1C7L9_9STRA|mmetsp:Transcript_16734/g.58538  ORF Transcript_16734/g.58538 Transcript_16734/m.58538 type:complete len:713 (+) Transcript_16734:220-2358(+)
MADGRVLTAADVAAVAAHVDALGRRCTVAEVVARGVDAGIAEASLSVLLRDGGGTFDIGRDGVCRYVFPNGFARRAAASRVMNSWRARARAAWPTVFYVLRMSIGAFLLPSFLLLALAASALACAAMRAGGGGRGGSRSWRIGATGGAHVRLPGGLDQLRSLCVMAVFGNPFFALMRGSMLRQCPRAAEVPLWVRWRAYGAVAREFSGYDVGAPLHVRRPPRLVVDGRLLTAEETAVRRAAMAGGAGDAGAVAAGAAGDVEAGAGEGLRADGGDLSFFEAVFSFVFGEGAPTPTDDDCWALVAAVIEARGGVVAAEELLPYVSLWLPGTAPSAAGGQAGWMSAVLMRFRGRPVAHEGGFLVYEFPLLTPAAAGDAAGAAGASGGASEGEGDSDSTAGSDWVVVRPSPSPSPPPSHATSAAAGPAQRASAPPASPSPLPAEASPDSGGMPVSRLTGRPPRPRPRRSHRSAGAGAAPAAASAAPAAAAAKPPPLPTWMEREAWQFSAASRSQTQRAVALGVSNIVLALVLGRWQDDGSGSSGVSSTRHSGLLAGHPYASFVVGLAARASGAILLFSLLFLTIPAVRYLVLTRVLNPAVARGNAARRAAAKALAALTADDGDDGGEGSSPVAASPSFDDADAGAAVRRGLLQRPPREARVGGVSIGDASSAPHLESPVAIEGDVAPALRPAARDELRRKLAFAAALSAGNRSAAM